jgi:Flp pilus assembly protein TadB
VAKQEPSDLRPDDVQTARRQVNRAIGSAAVAYLLVAAVAFWLGLPIVGVGMIVIGAVGLPLAKRRLDRIVGRRPQ